MSGSGPRTTPIYDTVPEVRPAGYVKGSGNSNAEECLKPELVNPIESPPTPPGQRKYRQSYRGQPGVRFISTGLVGVQQGDPELRVGIQSKKDESITHSFKGEPDTQLKKFLLAKQESQYASHQREPLGQSYNRGHVLGGGADNPDFKFGVPSNSSESSKGLIYRDGKDAGPPDTDFEVTRPVRRNYNWDSAQIDPNQHRFGKTEEPLINGAALSMKQDTESHIVNRRVAEFRAQNADPLGKSKPSRGVVAQLPPDHTFGNLKIADEWDARKCIEGRYTQEEQLPDRDLGLSTRKLDPRLAATNAPERVFGCASIRDDLAEPRVRSVGDNCNYGNELDGKGLLYPTQYTLEGLTQNDFLQEKTAQKVREVFKVSGREFGDEEFEQICAAAQAETGVLSVDSFRNAMNKIQHGIC